MCHTSHMSKKNDTNQATIRITRTVKDEATVFVGASPHPYTSLSKLGDDALRNWLLVLEKKYGGQKKK